MLAGVASFTAERDYAALARTLARRSALPGEEVREVAASQGLWLYSVAPSNEHAAPVAAQGAERVSYLFGDALRLGLALAPDAAADPVAHEVPLRWVALAWQANARTLAITTDRLGMLWLYTARIPDGIAFSTHFGALAQCLPGERAIDWDTVLLELAYGYSPDERTVVDAVRLAAPGVTTSFTATQTRASHARPVRYTDAGSSLSGKAKLERLDALYTAILDRFAHCRDAMSVSLSAGLDSRYALAFLQRDVPRPPCCTFGDPLSDEVAGAKRVARDAGVQTDVFDIPPGNWAQWTRAIRALGNAGMTQWSGWAESWLAFLGARGRMPLIGFVGDALSGKHLGPEARPPDWLEYWRTFSTDGGWAGSALLSPAARARIDEVGRERLRQSAAAAAPALPHQAGLHLDLYARQRRWVASQPNLMARSLTPVLFFYDQPLIDFWCSLPVDDLIGQRLYLAYARSRFPALFDEPPQPRGLAQRLLAKTVRVVTASDRERPRVIDPQRFIVPNRDAILALADRVGPMLEGRMDMRGLRVAVERFGSGGGLSGTLVARAVNVFMLLDLAQGRPDAEA